MMTFRSFALGASSRWEEEDAPGDFEENSRVMMMEI
jgi:hypothetical protein